MHDNGGTVAWRLGQLERKVDELERKVDRLTWALTLAALSFAGATAALLLTVATSTHT